MSGRQSSGGADDVVVPDFRGFFRPAGNDADREDPDVPSHDPSVFSGRCCRTEVPGGTASRKGRNVCFYHTLRQDMNVTKSFRTFKAGFCLYLAVFTLDEKRGLGYTSSIAA